MSRRSVSIAFACIIALLWCSKPHAFPPAAGVGAVTSGESHAAIATTSMAAIYAGLGITGVSRTITSTLQIAGAGAGAGAGAASAPAAPAASTAHTAKGSS